MAREGNISLGIKPSVIQVGEVDESPLLVFVLLRQSEIINMQ